MSTPIDARPWETLETMIDAGDTAVIAGFLDELPPGDATLAISRLDEERQTRLLSLLQPEHAAEVIERMPSVQAVAAVEQLPPEEAAAIFDELRSDTRADLLTELDEAPAEAIIAALDPESVESTRRMVAYDRDVAGGVMIAEYLAFPLNATVADVLADLRANAETYADYDVQYVYITTPDGGLAGVLRLRDLVLARGETPVSRLMIRDPLSVNAESRLDDLLAFFDEHGFFGVPVVDAAGSLVGVVRRGDVYQSLGERADQNYLKSQGIVGGEELRTMPFGLRTRRRFVWLAINIVLNVIAASVITFYEDTLSAVIALAVFLPIISDMSGCSGTQAVAVTMRELTLGVIRPTELMRVLRKELTVGFVNGVALGAIIGLVGGWWFGSFWIGVVAGVAMMLNMLVAVGVGGVLPLVLKRMKVDPALACGPILTTVTDMCGFFLVLFIATLLLTRIVG